VFKLIETATRNYRAYSPAEKARFRAALTGLGGTLLYLGYTAVTDGWRSALGIFLAIFVFCAVCAFAGWIGAMLGKIFGTGAGDMIGALLVLGFIFAVFLFIAAHWG
jgi:hypothetical protein